MVLVGRWFNLNDYSVIFILYIYFKIYWWIRIFKTNLDDLGKLKLRNGLIKFPFGDISMLKRKEKLTEDFFFCYSSSTIWVL